AGWRAELAQMIEWKAERGTGQKAGDMRTSYSRLKDLGGRPQYLITAATEQVISQYERIFRSLGWVAGMITPQSIGEAQWLIRQGPGDDQGAASGNAGGFDAAVGRGPGARPGPRAECGPETRGNAVVPRHEFYCARPEGE